jgi:hypothetical protein
LRRSLAWDSIIEDERLQGQLTQAQVADAKDKARTAMAGAEKAVRAAWSRILYPVKTDATPAGEPFELEALTLNGKNSAIQVVAWEKVKADSLIKEKLGPDSFWHLLKPLWPDEKPHLSVAEIAEWFSTYVYLPKLRDRVVLEGAIRDAVGKLDPSFGFASAFDAEKNRYVNLLWGRTPPEIMPATALLVRSEAARAQLGKESAEPTDKTGTEPGGGSIVDPSDGDDIAPRPSPQGPPKRFYGSVEIDMLRPVKAFDAILNAVVMELQRTQGAKVELTLEIEAETPPGFSESDIGVIRDNARQLKFKAESTGFGD